MLSITSPQLRRVALLRIVLGIGGVAAVIGLIAYSGPAAVAAAVRAAVFWMPLALALEAARIVTDVVATRSAFGARANAIPLGALVRAHLIGYAVGSLAPAGRAAAEATKAALLSRWVGAPAATAVAATNQAVTLVAVAIASIPCAIAAWVITGPSLLSLALVVHAAALAVVGTALRGGMRASFMLSWFRARFHRFGRHASAFHEAACETSLVPTGTLCAMVAGRVFQLAQIGVFAFALGLDVSFARTLLAQGVNLVVMAIAVLVPSQIGASEGAFALSAHALGTTVSNATVIALLIHVVQLAWVVVGAMTPVFWRPSQEPQVVTAT